MKTLRRLAQGDLLVANVVFLVIGVAVGVVLDGASFAALDSLPFSSPPRQWLDSAIGNLNAFSLMLMRLCLPSSWNTPPEASIVFLKGLFVLIGICLSYSVLFWLRFRHPLRKEGIQG